MARGIVTSGDIDMTERVLIGDAPTAFIVTLRTPSSVSFLSNILSHNQSVLDASLRLGFFTWLNKWCWNQDPDGVLLSTA